MSAEFIAKEAKAAFEASQLIDATERVRALHEIERALAASKDAILAANRDDLAVRPFIPPVELTVDARALCVRQPRPRSTRGACPLRCSNAST
jgi:hypothetical protein